MRLSFPPLLAVALAAVTHACQREEGEIVREKPTTFAAAEEVKIGATLTDADWSEAGVPLLVPGAEGYDPEAYDYLRPLVRGLTQQAGVTRRDSFAWDVLLVRDDETHAYTLPGGQIVLHTGLLHALANEAECVGILAREIALAEQGAAIAAYDRVVEDNVLLGDLLLGNATELPRLVALTSTVRYTPRELRAADSLAARLVCPSDYLHEGLLDAVRRIPGRSPYHKARPSQRGSAVRFAARVRDCAGSDSTYAKRYRGLVQRAVAE